MDCTDKSLVQKAVFDRPDDANKGTCGSLLSICGCYSMAGAAIMAGKAALRCGIGLLKSALPQSIYPIAAQSILESVFFPLSQTPDGKISADNIPFLLSEAQRSSAVLVGCGLSVCEDTKKIVTELILNCPKPMVLDADALNCISGNTQILQRAIAPIIVTPHPKEMSRLANTSVEQVNANRQKTALDFAQNHGVVCVLKGAGTIIADPDGKALINHTGNSGMATGGSGDVLAGIIAALLAQKADAFDAAAAGVYLHGLAGDLAMKELGKISMLPTDTINCIPQAIRGTIDN
jgi:NAD(P)H-hydrate epimerase